MKTKRNSKTQNQIIGVAEPTACRSHDQVPPTDDELNERARVKALFSRQCPPPSEEAPPETTTSIEQKLRRRLKVLEDSPAAGQRKRVDLNDSDTVDGECRLLREKLRAELARQYHKKPLRDMFQFDALITRRPEAGVECGSSGTTDDDGDCVNCERKYELRSTGDNTVRIQVPVGITPAEAVRVLRKAADWIEARPQLLVN